MKKNKDRVCVAIPVGGVVHEDYLFQTLKDLRKTDALVYVGIDSEPSLISLNNYESVYKISKDFAHEVVAFPPESYFRPGGIWKKMYICWQKSGAEYVRGIGYDDLLPPEIIVKQHEFMKKNSQLAATYANCEILDEIENRRSFQPTQLKGYDKIKQIGRNPFSFIAWLVKFSSIDNGDYRSKMEIASRGFEYFFHTYLFGLENTHFFSKPGESPIRREHRRTISHLQCTFGDKNEKVKTIREMTGYSEKQTSEDWKRLNLPKLAHQIRVKKSPLYAWAAKLEDQVRGLPY